MHAAHHNPWSERQRAFKNCIDISKATFHCRHPLSRQQNVGKLMPTKGKRRFEQKNSPVKKPAFLCIAHVLYCTWQNISANILYTNLFRQDFV